MLDRFEKFSYVISEISRYWHKITSDEMEKYGLNGPYAVYITALEQSPEEVTASKLCEVCGRDKADVSRAISTMEKRGLVKKEGSNYRARIILTEEGRAVARQIMSRARLAVELGGKGLNESEREVMYRSLALVAANLQKLSENGIPSENTVGGENNEH